MSTLAELALKMCARSWPALRFFFFHDKWTWSSVGRTGLLDMGYLFFFFPCPFLPLLGSVVIYTIDETFFSSSSFYSFAPFFFCGGFIFLFLCFYIFFFKEKFSFFYSVWLFVCVCMCTPSFNSPTVWSSPRFSRWLTNYKRNKMGSGYVYYWHSCFSSMFPTAPTT